MKGVEMVIWEKVWNQIVLENQKMKKGELGLRLDGRIEWVCEHGVGHTVWVEPKYAKINAWWSHGYDKCCDTKKFKVLKKRLKKVLK